MISVSGSCASKAFRRRRAENLTKSAGNRDPEAERDEDEEPVQVERHLAHDAEEERRAHLDVHDLGRAQRQVGLLETIGHALPVVERAADLLGRDVELVQHRDLGGAEAHHLAALRFCSVYGAIRFVAETPGFDDSTTRQPSRTNSAATPAIIARPAGLVGSFTTGPPPDEPEPGVPGDRQ